MIIQSNIQPSSIIQKARAIGVVNKICQTFRDEMSVQSTSDIHRKPSHTKDLNMLLDVLKEKHIDIIPERRHGFISRLNSQHLLGSVSNENIQDWIIEKIVPCVP